MKSFAIVLTLFACLFAFTSVQAEQRRGPAPRGQAQVNQKAVQKAVQRELARQRGSNSRARDLAIERELRRRELVDFNRRLIFSRGFVDPFGVRAFAFNPFFGRNVVFGSRRFAVSVGF